MGRTCKHKWEPSLLNRNRKEVERMRSWLWLERSGLAPESRRARPWQLEKGIMEKGAKREGIMAIVGKVCDITPPLKNHVLVI